MTKFFSGLFGLAFLVMTGTADAAQNLHQEDDGTAVWVREGVDGVEVKRPVGEVFLTVLLEDISTASTTAVTIPVTDAEISYIQAVVLGNISAAEAYVDFWIGDTTGGVVYSTEVTNSNADGATRMTITSTGAATGDVFTFTPADTSTNKVERNQTILIHTDGGSTGDHDVVFTITVIPR